MATTITGADGTRYVMPDLKTLVLNMAHPVGSYYHSSDPTPPDKLFGGTWERITNRFIFAASDDHEVGETGGAETNTLTTAQMPGHTHPFRYTQTGAGLDITQYVVNKPGTAYPNMVAVDVQTGADWSGNGVIGIGSTGAGAAFSIMPPYIAAYCWHRTA